MQSSFDWYQTQNVISNKTLIQAAEILCLSLYQTYIGYTTYKTFIKFSFTSMDIE